MLVGVVGAEVVVGTVIVVELVVLVVVTSTVLVVGAVDVVDGADDVVVRISESDEGVGAQAVTARIAVITPTPVITDRLKPMNRISAAVVGLTRPGMEEVPRFMACFDIDERLSMLFASAVPIEPGKTDRYRGLTRELEPHLEEYVDLNRSFEVDRHAFWINHSHQGDLGVSVYDISTDGLARMRQRKWDTASAYDRWWLGFVQDVNGIDMLQTPPHRAPPEQVFGWES